MQGNGNINNSNGGQTANSNSNTDTDNDGQSIQAMAHHAAAAIAAAMAAQQLLAHAGAILDIDLTSLSNFAFLAGQSNNSAGQANGLINGQPHSAEQLMAAAVAAAAFLSPNHHLMPEDLTVANQSQILPISAGSTNSTPAPNQVFQPQAMQQQQQQVAQQQQQQQQQQQHQHQQNNHHHRHHHLLGGHHHHSSIQTQQQLLATKGFNPMAVVVGSGQQTEILTPTHLRKAKLMFFYVRYPNSSTLKECFRDVRFNKNNTAQLVKWFSNFREFYYNCMDKFGREAVVDERIQCKDDIVVNHDHELINQLNNHYNKNRHIELPEVFRQVVEETLRHFYDAIANKRDQEQSWKKAIYKLIARLDQDVPEVFKSDAFNVHLE